EVQIRTRAMHSEAERGIAAHWAYKEGGKASAAQYEQINTLRELLTTLREADGASMDSEAFHGELLGERIYVFTPRGDVIDLPAGATPVDFAYAIHTEVGHRCRGTRVNGKMVALDYKLSSGEKVEIITANKGGPSRDWMNESLGYATSTRTRSKVRGWFRQQERDHNIAQGRELVARELRRLGVSDLYSIKDIAEALKYDDLESFLAQVGFGDVQSTQIGGAIAALQQKLRPDDDLGQLIRGQNKAAGRPSIGSTGGLATSLARCCNPIPPEPIVGYITRGRGITIHTQNCRQLSATREPERWIEMDWAAEQRTYPIPIVLRGYRRPGLIDDVANLLKRSHINLLRSKTTTATSVTTIYLEAEVSSLEQLNRLLEQLNDVNNVLEARRERWAD
ncbi:MAG: TGS domain-containing protein, partial [Candidatus Promineifilaceae bacterium]